MRYTLASFVCRHHGFAMHCNCGLNVSKILLGSLRQIILKSQSEIFKSKKHSFITVTESLCNIKYVPVEVFVLIV